MRPHRPRFLGTLIMVLVLMASACSVAPTSVEFAAPSTIVRETSHAEFQIGQELARDFRRAVDEFKDQPTFANLSLLRERYVEAEAFDALVWGQHRSPSDTEILMVRGADPTHPAAMALVIDHLDGPSPISTQGLRAMMRIYDEEAISAEVLAHYEAGPAPATFAGSTHTIRFAEPTSTNAWIVTLTPDQGDIDHDELVSVMSDILRGVTGPRLASDDTVADIEFNDHHIASFREHRFDGVRLGMSADAFTEATGIAVERNGTIRWDALGDLGDAGSILFFFNPEVGLFDVVHQFRLPERQLLDLATSRFGEIDPNSNFRTLAGLRESPPPSWTGQWRTQVDDHDDLWIITFESSIIVRSTMPGTEFAFSD